MGAVFLISLIIFGISVGLISIGFTEFDFVYDINSEYYISDEYSFEMTDDLFFENYYGNINYIVSDNEDVKVIYRHSKYYDVSVIEQFEGYIMHINMGDFNMGFVRTLIKDINDKKIINYSNNEINIYTTQENINIIKDNLKNYWQN